MRTLGFIFTFVLLILIFSGCASYEAQKDHPIMEARILENQVVETFDSLEIHFVTLKDKELSMNYLGIDPSEVDMIPVYMKIYNRSDNVVKIDLHESFLISETDEQYQLLPIDESIDRAIRSDADKVLASTVGFGLIGFMASASQTASVNKSLEEDYHEKYFTPTLINKNCCGKGVVFFNVPEEKQPHINTAIIKIINMNTNSPMHITLTLPNKTHE